MKALLRVTAAVLLLSLSSCAAVVIGAGVAGGMLTYSYIETHHK